MFLLVVFFGLTFLFWNFRLMGRLEKCEQRLEQWERAEMPVKRQKDTPIIPKQILTPPPQPAPQKVLRKPVPHLTHAPPVKPPSISGKKPSETSKLLRIIKENWMGVVGSMALVIGAVFFGLTADIMHLPEVRVGILIVVSCLFLATSYQLKQHKEWQTLRGWFKSIAGTLILFATLGAGGIEGLKCIDSPLIAFTFLCMGIAVNIFLSLRTPYEAVASFHVILSLLAFCMAPQGPLLLPVGAIVVCVGLIAAYRSKWDMHLLVIVSAFAMQNTLWTYLLGNTLAPWMDHLAIGCSLIVGVVAAAIHYSKKYQSPELEALPLLAHIANWGLLTWNIYLHTSSIPWAPFVLGAVAAAGFILARIAKKREILWLFQTDTILAQVVAIVAIVSLHDFSLQPLDILLLVLGEILAFNIICRLQKEAFLLRAGLFMQYFVYLVSIPAFLRILPLTPAVDRMPLYLRMGVAVVFSWGYHLHGLIKKDWIDDIRCFESGGENSETPLSLTSLFGTVIFLCMYAFGFASLAMQGIVLTVICMMAVWQKQKKDHSCTIAFVIALCFVHIMNFALLTGEILTYSHGGTSKVVALILLDTLLIFGNLLLLNTWRKNVHDIVIYALGGLVGLLTYVLTKQTSVLVPGLSYLAFSLLCLEVGRQMPKLSLYTTEVRLKICTGIINTGLAFFAAFLFQFATVYLQVDPIWKGISLRWAVEAMGVLSFFYWIASFPRSAPLPRFTQAIGEILMDACLGFITLCIFVELADVWRPLMWAFMATALLVGNARYQWPTRFGIYSWSYLIASIVHVAFVTNTLTMPSLFILEQHHIPALIAIAFQLIYACIAHRLSREIENERDNTLSLIYGHLCLTILLPIFLGIGLLFAYNFERTILTFLWVGLTCLYLGFGLLLKSKKSIPIAMAALVLCSLRLIVFDLMHSELAIRALVFIGVGSLMLGVSIVYKKYKHRVEAHESM